MKRMRWIASAGRGRPVVGSMVSIAMVCVDDRSYVFVFMFVLV